MKKLLFSKRLLLIISLYLVFRLINLTLLPIFNDESIYMDWGWRETTVPGNLFYSLYDSKQPLLMWLFGISLHVFQDSLFAGRIVSVLTGLLTLVGIYKIGKEYYSPNVGIIASLLYIGIPIFSFYDRQALMESAIGAIGIWSLFFFLQIIRQPKKIAPQIWFGFILGLGMMTKTNSILYLLSCIIILGIYFFRKSLSFADLKTISLRVVGVFFLTSGLLFIQPLFWQSLSLNSKYSLTISELLHFPILHTFQNALINGELLLVFITPLVVIAALVGIYYSIKHNKNIEVIYWFSMLVLLQTLLVRQTSQRYLVSMLPIITVFVGYALYVVYEHSKKIGIVTIMLLFSLPYTFTLLQIYSPLQYFMVSSQMSNYSDISGYIESANSGYGVKETVDYLKNQADNKAIYVATALNTGNPESALRTCFAKDPNVSIIYFDSQMFDTQLHDFDCLHTNKPFYFVSRDKQQAGLNKFFSEVMRFNNPYGKNSVGIYSLKPNCKGKVLPVDLEQIIQYENQK